MHVLAARFAPVCTAPSSMLPPVGPSFGHSLKPAPQLASVGSTAHVVPCGGCRAMSRTWSTAGHRGEIVHCMAPSRADIGRQGWLVRRARVPPRRSRRSCRSPTHCPPNWRTSPRKSWRSRSVRPPGTSAPTRSSRRRQSGLYAVWASGWLGEWTRGVASLRGGGLRGGLRGEPLRERTPPAVKATTCPPRGNAGKRATRRPAEAPARETHFERRCLRRIGCRGCRVTSP